MKTAGPAKPAETTKKSSFSIDSLAKSASSESSDIPSARRTPAPTPQLAPGAPPLQPGFGPSPFAGQHQELYRKALENLNESRKIAANNGDTPHRMITINTHLLTNKHPTALSSKNCPSS